MKIHSFKDIKIHSVRRPCLFLSNHQMTHPRQWTYQEPSTDMVANFDSVYKISPGDTGTAISQATTKTNIKNNNVITQELVALTSKTTMEAIRNYDEAFL